MTPIPFHLVRREDGQESVTVFSVERGATTVNDDHPNYASVIEILHDEYASLEDVFTQVDLATAIGAKFEPLSERVSVAHGRLYFDGDEVNDSVAEHILRFLDENVDDWQPLVAFMENVAANPNEHSREQLYDWLHDRAFTISPAGEIIAYKGVVAKGDGTYVSVNSGPAIVNGEAVNGQVPNNPGYVVEIARSKVEHDPATGCSTGLHAGTWAFAESFARGAVLKVLINPRDVVSVPTDCDAQKIRVCRYLVADVIGRPVSTPVDACDEDYDEPSYDDTCEDCGDPLCDGWC